MESTLEKMDGGKKKKKRKNNLNTQPYQIISLDIKTQELPPHDIMARC